jgi:hypothetical protein
MGELHDKLVDLGRERLLRGVQDRRDKRLVEIAAEAMGDDRQCEVFSHPGLCLTFLPHRQRPADEVWERTSGPWTLTVQPLHRHGGRLGVPYGPKARLIVLFLQTEAILTNSRVIELGRSMRSWLTLMGVSVGGKTYREVRAQAQRIEQAHLTVAYKGERATAVWQDSLVRGSLCPHVEDDGVHTVELSESFFRAVTQWPKARSARSASVVWRSIPTCGSPIACTISTRRSTCPGRRCTRSSAARSRCSSTSSRSFAASLGRLLPPILMPVLMRPSAACGFTRRRRLSSERWFATRHPPYHDPGCGDPPREGVWWCR